MAIDPYGRLAFGHLLQLHKELVLGENHPSPPLPLSL